MKSSSTLIETSQILKVMNKMMLFIDKRLVQHGERVAYIVMELMKHGEDWLEVDKDALLILSLLHDVGAYKTEEIDEMVSFESRTVWSHSIYGYLFLKNMSPMGEASEAILYHHLDYCQYAKANSDYLDYAALIYLADRVDILVSTGGDSLDFSQISKNSNIRFKPEYVDLFFNSQPENIVRNLRDGSYQAQVNQALLNLPLTKNQALEYLEMMVFAVDFRSEYTVTHTINTTTISLALGKRMGLNEDEQKRLYLGALLHDVGKIAISPDILEYQGRLTPQQMDIMKEHVVYTRKIIDGLVSEDISRIAYRHHEKLDGSGYPEGLRAADLTISEQIVAVADIVSALTGKRSYKEPFPKEKTLEILSDMSRRGQLCPRACEIMQQDFDDIITATDISRNPIIKLYNTMHQEYFELNNKVQLLLKQEKKLSVAR